MLTDGQRTDIRRTTPADGRRTAARAAYPKNIASIVDFSTAEAKQNFWYWIAFVGFDSVTVIRFSDSSVCNSAGFVCICYAVQYVCLCIESYHGNGTYCVADDVCLQQNGGCHRAVSNGSFLVLYCASHLHPYTCKLKLQTLPGNVKAKPVCLMFDPKPKSVSRNMWFLLSFIMLYLVTLYTARSRSLLLQ